MTVDECKLFLKEAFVAFPGLREYVNEKSPDPPKTFATWSKALATVSFEDAKHVLESWVTGALPDPPVGFRREMFALDVRACAQRLRENRTRLDPIEDYKLEDRANYRSPMKYLPIGPAMQRIQQVIADRNNGIISQSACDAEIDKIVFEACEAIDQKHK